MISSFSVRLALLAGASLCFAAPAEVIPLTCRRTFLLNLTLMEQEKLTSLEALDGLPAQASHYLGSVAGGACGFNTYALPAGIYGTALSSANW